MVYGSTAGEKSFARLLPSRMMLRHMWMPLILLEGIVIVAIQSSSEGNLGLDRTVAALGVV
jgi:hypothetical protein